MRDDDDDDDDDNDGDGTFDRMIERTNDFFDWHVVDSDDDGVMNER